MDDYEYSVSFEKHSANQYSQLQLFSTGHGSICKHIGLLFFNAKITNCNDRLGRGKPNFHLAFPFPRGEERSLKA